MELHRLLTFLGVALLVATFAIHYNEGGYAGEEAGEDADGAGGIDAGASGGGNGFSMAYVTGGAMLAAFMASFVLFNKEKLGGRGGWRGRPRPRR